MPMRLISDLVWVAGSTCLVAEIRGLCSFDDFECLHFYNYE